METDSLRPLKLQDSYTLSLIQSRVRQPISCLSNANTWKYNFYYCSISSFEMKYSNLDWPRFCIIQDELSKSCIIMFCHQTVVYGQNDIITYCIKNTVYSTTIYQVFHVIPLLTIEGPLVHMTLNEWDSIAVQLVLKTVFPINYPVTVLRKINSNIKSCISKSRRDINIE